MGDVHLVAVDDRGVNAALNPVHDELPSGRPGLHLGRARIEVGERPGEHDLCQYRVVPDEGPERLDRAEQVGAGVIGFRQPAEAVPEEPEALEEHLPDQAGRSAAWLWAQPNPMGYQLTHFLT